MIPTEKPEWMNEAKCKGNTSIFYPLTVAKKTFSVGMSNRIRKAKKICDGCPVQNQCLSYAVETDQHWGIWGGVLFQELNRQRKPEPQCLYGHKRVRIKHRWYCRECSRLREAARRKDNK